MTERDWADRFTHDVDSLLAEAGRSDAEPMPTEYRQALELARALAMVDFSGESRVRQSLRRRLLSGGGVQEEHRQRVTAVRTPPYRRRALVMASVILAVCLAGMLIWPGTLMAAARGIYGVIRRIVVGPHTEVVQVEVEGEPRAPTPLPSGTWHVDTEVCDFAGDVLPGEDPTVYSTTDFKEAQELVPFHIQTPRYLPDGYALREIKLVSGHAFLFYGGPGHDIVLLQARVGPQPGGAPNVAVGVDSGVITDGTVEEVELNGRPAAWTDGHSLTWETDSISYFLGGLDLTLEEAIHIAESLE